MTRALRRGAPIALASVTALLLVGCAGSAEPEPTASPDGASAECADFSSGASSDAVEVTGDFGAEATAEFAAPLEAEGIERSFAIEGEGDDTAPGDDVQVLISIFSGESGERLASDPALLTVGEASLFPAFDAGISCVPVGSRVVTVAAADEVYEGQGNEQIGLAAGDDIVVVTDVLEVIVPDPLPTVGEWTEDQPEVAFNGEEPPTLTLPGTTPSPDLQALVLEEGDGATVGEGDQVTIDYQGTSWDTGEIFDQSYGQQPATFATDQVIPGFGAALVGQKVGTSLVVTIPPEFAYGTEASDQNQLGGQTLVFVIEIRDTQAS